MAKQLVPIANKPTLYYGLEDLAAAGITEVGIVVSPETAADIQAAVGDGSLFGIKPTFIAQEQPLGIAHAVGTALEFIDGDDCIVYLGDNLVKQGVEAAVAEFRELRPNCLIMLSSVENPSAFGVAELDGQGRVRRLVEKPKDPPSDLALVGVYLFDNTVAEAVQAIEPSDRGELEITDAIQYLLDTGRTVHASVINGWWKDTGAKSDLLHANELVLSDLSEKVEGELVNCRVRGPVRVGAGSLLIDCDISGPVVVGRDVAMTRVTIGSNTSVGDRSRLTDCTLDGSIIMEGSEIDSWRLRESVVGRESTIVGSAPEGFVELTVGERSGILGE
jgi:glucose-1-phosphate thymidylyltransferase